MAALALPPTFGARALIGSRASAPALSRAALLEGRLADRQIAGLAGPALGAGALVGLGARPVLRADNGSAHGVEALGSLPVVFALANARMLADSMSAARLAYGRRARWTFPACGASARVRGGALTVEVAGSVFSGVLSLLESGEKASDIFESISIMPLDTSAVRMLVPRICSTSNI